MRVILLLVLLDQRAHLRFLDLEAKNLVEPTLLVGELSVGLIGRRKVGSALDFDLLLRALFRVIGEREG